MEKSLKIIAAGLKSEDEIKSRLADAGFQDYSVMFAVEKLKDYKYINDFEYAKQFILSKKIGRLKAEFELEKKGISKEIVNQIYSENDWLEQENINYHIEKNKKKSTAQKFGILVRNGFEKEGIVEVLGIEEESI